MLAKPPLADLRVAAWADRVLFQAAEGVFGGHDEFDWGERGDEDDASVRLQGQRVRRFHMCFERCPLRFISDQGQA